MLSSIDLRPSQLELLQAIAFELSQISGVVAIVLGGSHARGSARPIPIWISEYIIVRNPNRTPKKCGTARNDSRCQIGLRSSLIFTIGAPG